MIDMFGDEEAVESEEEKAFAVSEEAVIGERGQSSSEEAVIGERGQSTSSPPAPHSDFYTSGGFCFVLSKLPDEFTEEELVDFLRSFLPRSRPSKPSPDRPSAAESRPSVRPSDIRVEYSGPDSVVVVCRERKTFVRLMESRPFVLWHNRHLDCAIPDEATKRHFCPLCIRRSDEIDVSRDDLPALESNLAMMFGGVLTVEMDAKGNAVAWFFERKTVEDALLMGGILCVDIFFTFHEIIKLSRPGLSH